MIEGGGARKRPRQTAAQRADRGQVDRDQSGVAGQGSRQTAGQGTGGVERQLECRGSGERADQAAVQCAGGRQEVEGCSARQSARQPAGKRPGGVQRGRPRRKHKDCVGRGRGDLAGDGPERLPLRGRRRPDVFVGHVARSVAGGGRAPDRSGSGAHFQRHRIVGGLPVRGEVAAEIERDSRRRAEVVERDPDERQARRASRPKFGIDGEVEVDPDADGAGPDERCR